MPFFTGPSFTGCSSNAARGWRAPALGFVALLLCSVTDPGTLAAAEAEATKEAITLVVGQPAGPTEKLAASEAAAMLQQLFDVPVQTMAEPPASSQQMVVVGTAASNPAVAQLLGDRLPKSLDPQAILLRSFSSGKHSGVVATGGSPAAVLWSVYELGHHFGVRWLPRDDFYPVEQPELKLSGIDRHDSPAARIRGWELLGTSALGTTAFSLKDHRALLGQLAKLRCNHIVLTITDSQPFLNYSFAGMQKQSSGLFGGRNYSLEGDSPGRAAFPDERRLINPDLPPTDDAAAAHKAGRTFLQALVQQAHELGMTAELSIPLNPPLPEFRGVLYQAAEKEHARLLETRLAACLEACPQIDGISLRLPENTTARIQLRQLARLKAVAGAVAELKNAADQPVAVTVQHPQPVLFGHLAAVLPAKTAVSVLAGAPAGTAADAAEQLADFPAASVPARLTISVAGAEHGVLSQFPGEGLPGLVQQAGTKPWQGFVARCWLVGEIDLPVSWMFRAGFTPGQSLREAHDDLFVALTRHPAATGRLWKGFNHIGRGQLLLAAAVPGLAQPVAAGATESLLDRYYRNQDQPAGWEDAGSEYNSTFVEMYRARGPSHLRSKQFLFYYAKRSEYVVAWLAGVEALRQAAVAHKTGDLDTAIEQVDTAIESFYNALDTLGDVARTSADRAEIAVLNAELFRPLMALSDRLLEEADE